jgi:predicted ATPase
MRIKRLIVSKFKNVENLDLEFGNHLISLLVGRNGLGKSNLIEILAMIFKDLELLDTQQEMMDWAFAEDHFEYSIYYECKNSDLIIHCKKGEFQVLRRQRATTNDFSQVEFNHFKENRREEYLPKYIIGYYSGENKRIKNIIRPYEQMVWDELKNNEGLDKEFRRIFFGENHHAQIILLTLLLYKEQNGHDQFRTKANELIDRFCSFADLQQISLVLKQPSWFRRSRRNNGVVPPLSIENLEQNLLGVPQLPYPFWGAKEKADKIITYLYNNSQNRNGYFDEELKIEKLTLEAINQLDLAAGVYEAFGHPINFFDAFESLQLIGSIDSMQMRVKSKQEGVSFDFAGLSEGEQQLITVLGLILITGKDDCLFLLDEPDTHLNPIWQRTYVQLLEDFNLNDDNSHIIVATHSPLIVQAAEGTDIFLYRQDETGKVVVDENDMKIHNWRIDQVLASEYFGFKSTRPPSLDNYMKLKEEILAEGDFTEEMQQKLAEFENQFGVLPTGETMDEIESLQMIKSIVREYKQANDKDK